MSENYETKDVAGIDNPEVGHEKRDINVRIVVGFGVSLLIAAIIIHVFVWLLFGVYGNLEMRGYPREFPLVQSGQVRLPPAPRLQDKPREDLKEMRRQENELLDSYTWINQQTGAVRVPIADAMKRVVDQGLPVTDQPAPPPPDAPTSSSSGRALAPAPKR